jgi:acetyltransferase
MTEYEMTFDTRAIDTLLNPTSVAIVGASDSSPWAATMVGHLRRFGYDGTVQMVNPRRTEVFAQTSYPSLRDLPVPADHAVILTPAATLPMILEDCTAAGVKSVTVVAAGFQEAGVEGRALADTVKSFCEANGIALIGPNCYGFANFDTRALLTRNTFDGLREPEGIAVVSQSGGLQLAICQAAYARGVGLTFSVSSGNELVVDSNDYYDYLLRREDIKVIAGTLERIPKPERFRQIAQRAAELGKPIVLLKLGKSAAMQKLAVAHTGSVAGEDVVVDTFLRDMGVIRVDSVDELVDTAALLARAGWPKDNRTMFLSFTGGVCGMFADLAEPAGIDLVPFTGELRSSLATATGLAAEAIHNPFDATMEGVPNQRSILDLVERSGAYDAVLMNNDAPRNDDEVVMLRGMIGELRALRDRGMFVAAYGAAQREPNDIGVAAMGDWGVPYLQGAVGIRALGHAQAYGRWKSRRSVLPIAIDDERRERVRSGVGGRVGALSEQRSKAVLAEYGIPLTAEGVMQSADEAAEFADHIGYPVVLKVVSPDIPHKSEAGGVILDLRDAAAVRVAFGQIVQNAHEYDPQASIDGVLVSEMVVGGTEFFVGVTSDDTIGPIVVAGLGGIYVETIKDAVTTTPPVSSDRARELLMDLQSAPLLRGVRGLPALDIDAFADVISKVSRLAVENRDFITEIDINPLLVLPEGRGVRAVDALVVVRGGK